MEMIRHLRETLSKTITRESICNDVYAKNVGSAISAFSLDYFNNKSQRQIDNYANSLNFLDDDKGNQVGQVHVIDDLAEFDIADISPQEINQVTLSGMSWVDAVKQLKETASNMKMGN